MAKSAHEVSSVDTEGNQSEVENVETSLTTSEPEAVKTDDEIPDDLNVNDASEISAVEELTNIILDKAEEIPDMEYMIEYLTSHELDEGKSKKFIRYINTLDEQQRLALWESFKGTFGSSVNTITAAAKVETLIKAVDQSQSLKLRNKAVQAEMSRAASLYAILQRQLRSDLSDTPLNNFRIDNTAQALQKSYRDISILNSAILSMAQMLMVGDVNESEVADCVINIERAVKICATVGYSAKPWQNVYEQATLNAKQAATEIDNLKVALKNANESAQSATAQLMQERKRHEALTLHANSYVIGNNSGFYISTVNKPTEDTLYYRVSPYNLRLTTERDEAVELMDIETAREVYDAVQEWAKRNFLVRHQFKTEGVNAETLFIMAASLTKVS